MAVNVGVIHCIGTYVLWGVFPIYWKQLEGISADQLALHRIVWSFVFLLGVVAVTGQWSSLGKQAQGWRVYGTYTVSAVFVMINWTSYIWAVNAGYIVQTSLGYFITPLLNVLVGVLFFKEKLRLWQWLAIILAFSGVLVVAIAYGKFPYIALTIAVSFSVYGMVKKQAPLNALHGLTLETGILFLPAVVYLVTVEIQGTGVFLHIDTVSNVLLVGAGIVTVVPLLLFASAAQKIPFNLLGMLQYIAPSLMFIMGVVVYGEEFSTNKLIGFILVWLALIMYSVEGIIFQKKQSKAQANIIQSPGPEEISSYERA